jgi:hypothetical protein
MLKKMRESMCGYTVKKLKSMMGRDGVIWSCEVHYGKNKVVDVFNDGYGGPTSMQYTDKALKAEFIHIAKIKCPEFDFEQDDSFAAHLADTSENISRLVKKCKKETLYQLQGDEEDSYRVAKIPYSPNIAIKLRAKYGANLVCIINEEV